MSSRARKRARAAAAGEVSTPVAPRPPSRSEIKNAEARAKLVPLRDGERPTAVTVAAVIATALVATNLVLPLAGYGGTSNSTLSSLLVFTALLTSMAWGLWRARYWAVLGMQALLALIMARYGIAAVFASNLRAVLVSLAVLAPAAALFWFLIKAMARIQMPERR
jgi:hypothetical protein